MSRLFSDEELELLATPLSIRLERAALADDFESIAEIVSLMELECTAIYDKQSVWTAALQVFVADETDEVTHDRALRDVAAVAFRPAIEDYRGLSSRDRVAAVARHLRAAGGTFWVTQEGDRVRFRLDPSGGARLGRATMPLRRDGRRIRYPCQGAAAHARRFLETDRLFFERVPSDVLGAPIATVAAPDDPDAPTFLDVTGDGESFTEAELERLATPLSLRVEEHAARGDLNALLGISAAMDEELVAAKDPLNLLNAGLLSWIARELGEDRAEAALLRAAEVVMGPAIAAVRDAPFAEAFRQFVMVWRAHGSTFWIEEDDDVVVLRGRPIGACGRLWARAAPQQRISESRVRYRTWGAYDPPLSFHVVQSPGPMTSGEIGMPIYSCHCHVFHEIYALQTIGRPLWIEEHPVHDRDGETVHVHYKDHAAWPARYSARVGLARR